MILCVRSCRGSCLSYEDFSSLTRLRGLREAPVSPAKTSALFRIPATMIFFPEMLIYSAFPLYRGLHSDPARDPLHGRAISLKVKSENLLTGRALCGSKGALPVAADDRAA